MIASGPYYDLIAEIEAHIDDERIDAALEKIKQVADEVFRSKLSSPRAIGSVELDRLCLRAGQAMAFSPPSVCASEGPCDVYIATEVYPTGGHSLWIADLMRARPERRAVLLLTNTLRRAPDEKALQRFTDMGVVVEVGAEALYHAERLQWLRKRLAFYRPVELSLMTHMQDAVGIAAAQPSAARATWFFHHCDHAFSLGVHLPHALHVDFRPAGFRNCREGQRLDANVCVPLVSDTDRPPLRAFGSERLSTCTSGDYKFDLPYSFHFSRVVPVLLEKTGGTHHHIGPLSAETVNATRQRLDELGLAQDRFQVHSRCPSLWRKLVELGVDIYLDSFPLAGCKSVIEAISAGIPVVVHENYTNPLFSGGDIAYPEAFCWRHPDELVAFLPAVDAAWLTQQSACARRHFERENLPEILSERLVALRKSAMDRAGARLAGPRPDPLASLWDLASSALHSDDDLFQFYGQKRQRNKETQQSGVDFSELRRLLATHRGNKKSVDDAMQILRLLDMIHPFLQYDEQVATRCSAEISWAPGESHSFVLSGEDPRASLTADKEALTELLFSLACRPSDERAWMLALLHAVTEEPLDETKPSDAHAHDVEISTILFQLALKARTSTLDASRSRTIFSIASNFLRRLGKSSEEGNGGA